MVIYFKFFIELNVNVDRWRDKMLVREFGEEGV